MNGAAGRKAPLPQARPVDDLNREAREAIWISPDQNTAEGRWYWGDYQEFGFDVTLLRASAGTDYLWRQRYRAENG